MTNKLAQAISAARSKEGLAAILDMLYDEMKNIYANGLDVRHLIKFAPPQGHDEYVVFITGIRFSIFSPYHHFDVLDAIGALYKQHQNDDWHERFYQIHARAFCDAVLSRVREYYPQIASIEPHGDLRRGFETVRVRLAKPA